MNKTLLLTTLALIAATAQANPAATARVQDFKSILRNFERMGTVVRNREPYRPQAFAALAAALKHDAAQPFGRFTPGTQAGSRAKTEVWSQRPRFDAEKKTFLERVAALDAAAQQQDLSAIRISYGQVAQSCKSCHDAFRGPAQ